MSRCAQRRTGLRTSLPDRPRLPRAGAPGAFARRRSELPRPGAPAQRARPGGGRVRDGRPAALPDHHRDPPLRQGHELLARPEPRRERGSPQGGGQHLCERRRVRHLGAEPARDERAPDRRHDLDPGRRRRSTSACRKAATSATRSPCRSAVAYSAAVHRQRRSRCAAARRCGSSSRPSFAGGGACV